MFPRNKCINVSPYDVGWSDVTWPPPAALLALCPLWSNCCLLDAPLFLPFAQSTIFNRDDVFSPTPGEIENTLPDFSVNSMIESVDQWDSQLLLYLQTQRKMKQFSDQLDVFFRFCLHIMRVTYESNENVPMYRILSIFNRNTRLKIQFKCIFIAIVAIEATSVSFLILFNQNNNKNTNALLSVVAAAACAPAVHILTMKVCILVAHTLLTFTQRRIICCNHESNQ